MGIRQGIQDIRVIQMDKAEILFYRNLPAHERARLALRLKPVIAEKAKEQHGIRNDIPQKSAESFKPIETRQELAKVAGVSHDTIAKKIICVISH